MRTKLFAAMAAVVGIVGISAPAEAITNGKPDNGALPNVGLVVFYDSSGATMHRCTGTMISATTLLTAGHCTSGTASAQVWFNESVTAGIGYFDTDPDNRWAVLAGPQIAAPLAAWLRVTADRAERYALGHPCREALALADAVLAGRTSR